LRLPRDISGDDLARRLGRVGYSITRHTGSHMRLTITVLKQHHVTIPRHHALRLGTLAGILDDVAAHMEITRDELQHRLFD
jgi:predicted RNA binding protein YcfA (HicA-like mRNA interferase family)